MSADKTFCARLAINALNQALDFWEEAEEVMFGRNQIQLSLIMIVRDNEGIIVPCLQSIRPWVDD